MNEWLSPKVLKKLHNISWNEAITNLHNPKKKNEEKKYINRLAFDEILSTFLINSNIRKNFKKKFKIPKNIYPNLIKLIEKKIGFELTTDQIKALDQINLDISSKERMFRLLQGDVGSGKTIVSLIAAINASSTFDR